jgi:probable HAF family extracellular repeat protein
MRPHLRALTRRPVARAALALALLGGTVSAHQSASLPRYSVTDLGTLGGTFSLAYGINNRGQISGFSTLAGDTTEHSFVIEHGGSLVDLGTLGGPDSQSFSGLNDFALVSGASELATMDPDGENFCGFFTGYACAGFLWKNGVMMPLESAGGNNSQSTQVNNFGLVSGVAETGTRAASCPPPQVMDFRPVLWWGLRLFRVLPLYGGDTEGMATWLNNRGEAVGASGDCSAFDGRYGLPLQPRHALLWRQGRTINLGSLGGEFNNAAFAINDLTEVVGASDLAGDTASDGTQHAFLWRRGTMTDLGVLPGDQVSAALGINDRGQVTGVSLDADGHQRAFLWQDGTMFDLNDLIAADSGLYLLHGFGINDAGKIVGMAIRLSSGEVHAFLATPAQATRHGLDVEDDGGVRPRARFVLSAHERQRLNRLLRARHLPTFSAGAR